MANDFYTAEQVAELLGLHVRTVRNYIQDGRLPAVRIGKQYRITPAGLAALTSGDSPASEIGVDVTSIVDATAIDEHTASRLALFLSTAATGRGPSARRLRIDTAYDTSTSTLKIVVFGGAGDVAEVLRLIDTFVEGSR
ncbi:DNA-binding protein [Rhodococcus sp. RS1C4]|uniref:helix-turn-helix domain-containing protein n=1 Tax=Nocardiaceae TaxID=85025 RepID=UPI00037A0BA3|nr:MULTISPECIES: helix-turn-helix domain-containing protein [Rhodococcus]OZC56342.1 DNA-binding protein [Rhodococcus sp. RS1C4]OZC78334.1 DNA-binding protein [Rhodococcus sp. 06-418-1B]OZD17677.1 DNA-binding protein [Rhodococcus sp. 06-156-4C]OZD20289.1 DNA-binding protein [Rhodococcus sp. 06-156-3C]OZD21523.1 DNA-binding protein [Rhodococcus sp. 06-156-4a]